MAILFGILTACTNAFAVTTQHIASTSSTSQRGWHLIAYLFRHPLWLLGWIGLIGSLVFQAFALHFGTLSSVQPVLLTELVFALVLRRFWLRQDIRRPTWIAALATCVLLSIFLASSAPRGVPTSPTREKWIVMLVVVGVILLTSVVLGQSGSPSRRAASLSFATSVSWAVEACFIKAATDSFNPGGIAGALSRWPIYAFAIGGLLGLLLEQWTLHVGPLKVSLPILVIVDPIVSVILGVGIFAEHFEAGTLRLVLGIVAFVAMCATTFVMTQTTPIDMTGEVRKI